MIFLTSVNLNKIDGGEKHRTISLLNAFSRLYENVHLIAPGYDENLIGRGNIIFHKHSFTFTRRDVLIKKYFIKDQFLCDVLEELIVVNSNKLALLDFEFHGQYISMFKKASYALIYSTHNYQSHLTYQQIKFSTGISKAFRTYNYLAQWLHERIYFKHANMLLVCSKQDQRSQAKLNSNIQIVNNVLWTNGLKNFKSKDSNFIVVANYNAYMNEEGVRWLLNRIWPHYHGAKKLLIVGKGADIFNNYRAEFGNIEIHSDVKDLLPYYEQASTALIPLKSGSGTRLKVLEGLMYGMRIITTSKGIEGLAITELQPLDIESEWIDELNRTESSLFTTNQSIAAEYETNYSQASLLKRLNELLKSIKH